MNVTFSKQHQKIIFDSEMPVTDLRTGKSVKSRINKLLKNGASDYSRERLFTNGNCILDGGFLYGIVPVQNKQYEKNVYCRFTTDEWKTWNELEMKYVRSVGDKDYFQFIYKMGNIRNFKYCFRIEMDQTYWENNGGLNYSCIIIPVAKELTKTEPRANKMHRDIGIFREFSFMGSTQVDTAFCF